MRVHRTALAFGFIAAQCAASFADDFSVPIKDFPIKMSAALQTVGDQTKISLDHCLDGGADKRTVCSYKLDNYMVAMAAGAVGEDQLSDLTLICTPETNDDSLRCLTAYGASFAAFEPSIPFNDRGKIIKTLITGIGAGDAVQVTKDNHRFILQHVGGSLWFHLEANPD